MAADAASNEGNILKCVYEERKMEMSSSEWNDAIKRRMSSQCRNTNETKEMSARQERVI